MESKKISQGIEDQVSLKGVARSGIKSGKCNQDWKNPLAQRNQKRQVKERGAQVITAPVGHIPEYFSREGLLDLLIHTCSLFCSCSFLSFMINECG